MNKKCEIILNGGNFSKFDCDRFIISCDGSWDKIDHKKTKVDLIIGDFDSIKSEVPNNVPSLRFPKEKDDTDSMLAVKWAIGKGFDDIKFNGVFGRRIDHEYANLQCGLFAYENAKKVTMENKDTFLTFIRNKSEVFPKRKGFSLSVFSFSSECCGVSIVGTKYEVLDKKLTNNFPLGISNEWKNEYAEISVKKGTLMIIQSKIN